MAIEEQREKAEQKSKGFGGDEGEKAEEKKQTWRRERLKSDGEGKRRARVWERGGGTSIEPFITGL